MPWSWHLCPIKSQACHRQSSIKTSLLLLYIFYLILFEILSLIKGAHPTLVLTVVHVRLTGIRLRVNVSGLAIQAPHAQSVSSKCQILKAVDTIGNHSK